MISCTLNGKKYTVDFVSGRALREMEPAAQMYGRIVAISNAALKGEVPEDAKNLSIGEALDVMIRWFCLLFGNQFTPDDVLDYYPVDRMMHDIALALMAVQTQTTEILDEFPTKAGDASILTLPDFIYSTYNSLLEGGWRMSEIDGMDMLGFLRVRAWSARKEKEKKQPRHAYIDQVWQSLKP